MPVKNTQVPAFLHPVGIPGKDDDEILMTVMDRIEAAEIWIPFNEVRKHYRSVRNNLRKRLNKELRKEQATTIVLEPFDHQFAVCKVTDYSGVDVEQPFCFTGVTDEEKTIVCLEEECTRKCIKV